MWKINPNKYHISEREGDRARENEIEIESKRHREVERNEIKRERITIAKSKGV